MIQNRRHSQPGQLACSFPLLLPRHTAPQLPKTATISNAPYRDPSYPCTPRPHHSDLAERAPSPIGRYHLHPRGERQTSGELGCQPTTSATSKRRVGITGSVLNTWCGHFVAVIPKQTDTSRFLLSGNRSANERATVGYNGCHALCLDVKPRPSSGNPNRIAAYFLPLSFLGLSAHSGARLTRREELQRQRGQFRSSWKCSAAGDISSGGLRVVLPGSD